MNTGLSSMALSRGRLVGFVIWMCVFELVLSELQTRPFRAARGALENLDDALIPTVCQATRFADLCSSSLSADVRSGLANSTELVRIAIDLAAIASAGSSTLVQNMMSTTLLDINATSAAAVCGETLGYGAAILATARDSLLVKPVQDTQAWLSAALQFEYDCFSALGNVVDPPAYAVTDVLPQVNTTMKLISNALCMTDALTMYGSVSSGWKPPVETRPENISAVLTSMSLEWVAYNDSCVPDPSLGALTPNVTVSQDGLSNYITVQDAVDNAPTYSTERYIIYIKAGIYTESVRVHQNKTFIMFVGDGVGATILTGNKNANPGLSTFQTATVVVVGMGFVAKGITFQNSAGPYVNQAVAVRVDADLSAFQDCSFDGYQDTLYAHTGRQFYKNCTILGTVDFIFGNAAAVFQSCQLVMRSNRPGVTTDCITAQGRTDPGQTTGLVFQNCTITGTPDYMNSVLANQSTYQAFLGRPWKLFSRTIFLDTYISGLIQPAGWFPWDGDFALETLLFGESDSYGPGVGDISSRVPWSNQLSDDQRQPYTVDNFIQGSWWLPCTGVPYFL